MIISSKIVHELRPFLAPLGGQNMIWIFCKLMKVWWGVRIGSFYQKLRYFTDQNGPKRGPHGNGLWLFSNTKMNVTNSQSGISRWKKSRVMFLKLSKKVHFLQLCAELSKKPKSVKAIYMYASGSSHYTLSENGMAVYKGLIHRSLLVLKISKKRLTQQKFNKIFPL